MRLNITITSKRDYGEYHCVSKNEMSLARGVFHVQGKLYIALLCFASHINMEERNLHIKALIYLLCYTDHNPYVVKPLPELTTPQIYGNKAPPKESFEDICGPPTTCPECPDPKYGVISSFTCYTSSSTSTTTTTASITSASIVIVTTCSNNNNKNSKKYCSKKIRIKIKKLISLLALTLLPLLTIKIAF